MAGKEVALSKQHFPKKSWTVCQAVMCLNNNFRYSFFIRSLMFNFSMWNTLIVYGSVCFCPWTKLCSVESWKVPYTHHCHVRGHCLIRPTLVSWYNFIILGIWTVWKGIIGTQAVSRKIVISSKIMLMMVIMQSVGPLLLSKDFPVVKTQSR